MKRHMFVTALLTALVALQPAPAPAGCGCDKAPPAPASVRPNVTFSGMDVTLFGPGLQAGADYMVLFESGTNGDSLVGGVEGTVVVQRDLADAQEKAQLVVTVPQLPLGPTSITVVDSATGSEVMAIGDASFTVAPAPVSVPADYGSWTFPGFQAAVGRDGTAYVALDLQGLQKPMVMRAQAAGYPLRFGGDDVVFTNTQGFLMQLLMQNTEPVPGMFVLPTDAAGDSDVLHYSRHEFATYFLQHGERQEHATDPLDPRWHEDGTPHIDHDHLILAIMGELPDGSAPAPGATPVFDLEVTTHSLFHNGLVGDQEIWMAHDATTDSYDPTTGAVGLDGDVYSNGLVEVTGQVVVGGDVTGSSITVRSRATVMGETHLVTEPVSFMEVQVPAGIPDLGSINLDAEQSMVLSGPGSFRVHDLITEWNSTLYVDNSAGPVTVYVTGKLAVWENSKIETTHPDPERFAVYVASTERVELFGSDAARFEGVVYAPTAPVDLASGDFYGAFVGASLDAYQTARIHYPVTLRGESDGGTVETDPTNTTTYGANTSYGTDDFGEPTTDASTSTASTSDGDTTDASTSDGSTTSPKGKRGGKKK